MKRYLSGSITTIGNALTAHSKVKLQWMLYVNGLKKTPLWEDVHANYETENERIQLSNYQRDLQLRKVK
ncbi:hypothetical protein H5117_02360 [Pseudoalteromonas sp. SG45-1]|nr:hypothetical protein [Pseudoalteromonas sp. SG45-1]